MLYQETQTDLSDFCDIPRSQGIDKGALHRRFRQQPIYINQKGTTNIRAPFCPECGSHGFKLSGTVLKRTQDILGEAFYFVCQQYQCHHCDRSFSAFIKNIIVYDEEMVSDKFIQRVDEYIKEKSANDSMIHQLGDKILELIDNLISNHISLQMSANAHYTKDEIIELFIRNSINTSFLETTRNLLELDDMPMQIPSADTALLYIGRKNLNDLKMESRRMFSRLIDEFRIHGLFSDPIDIAIDFHQIEYYGKMRDEMVKGGKSKNGTSFFHEYVTIDCVDNNSRSTLIGDHVTQFDNPSMATIALFDFVKNKKVPINRAFLDREFFNTTIIDYLVDEGIKFVIPAVKNKKVVAEAENNWNKGIFVFNYHFGEGKKKSQPFTIFMIPNKKYDPSKKNDKKNPLYFIFATNMKIKKTDQTAEGIRYNKRHTGNERKDLAELYRMRWGIETDFRVLDHEFLGKTTSNNRAIRYFYAMMGMWLRNIWVLSKTLFTDMFGQLFSKNTITARLFSRIIEKSLDRRKRNGFMDGLKRLIGKAHII